MSVFMRILKKENIGVSKKKKIIAGVLAVVVLISFFGIWTSQKKKKAMNAMKESFSQIQTVQVVRQNLIDSISVTGTIASADAWDVSASAKNVEVLQVNYEVGDYVNQGDVVAVLDTTDLEISLEQAKNSQALSEYKESTSISTATENYQDAVEDGTDSYNDAVKREAEAKEDLQEAESDLSEAASRLKRREERLNSANKELKALSEGDAGYEEAQRAVQEAKSAYTEAHQAYQSAASAEEKALEAYENAVESLENAQKNNDKNISNAAKQLEQAQMEHQYSNDSSQKTIENYEEQISSCTVTAPISGVITAMNIAVGDTYMGEGNTMFSVADNEHFIVQATVDEYDISSIQKNMDAAVIVEAIGDDELPAAVSFVSPTANNSNMGSSSYSIEIALTDANTDLRIGMTAKASIVLDAAYDVLTVPYDCVETDDKGNSKVYIDKNGEKTELFVEVGMESDYYVEIFADGLDEQTMVYYATAMINGGESSNSSNEEGMSFPGGGGMPSGGGQMPSGGGGGGMPSGGGGGGMPGGF